VDRARIEQERRAGVPAAMAALGAMLLPAVAVAVPRIAVEPDPEGARGTLLAMAKAPGAFIAGGVMQAVGTALIAVVFLYLYRATRARRPETPRITGVLAVAGPLLFAAVILFSQIALVRAGADYAARGGSIQELLRGGMLGFIRSVGYSGTFALGLATLLVSLNAMRAGLLSRFLGALGIAIGVVSALPLFGATPLLQSFWLGALALLLLDRWPGGRGPAWSTGEAVPWPSAADLRARAARGAAPPEGHARGEAQAEAPERPRPASRKRRRRVR
jgi:hypothetical protein